MMLKFLGWTLMSCLVLETTPLWSMALSFACIVEVSSWLTSMLLKGFSIV